MAKRKPFESLSENDAILERLKASLGETKRGTLIPWHVLEAIIGYHHRSPQGANILRRFRAWLLTSYHIVTDGENGGAGLRLLTTQETIVDNTAKHMRRARRQQNRQIMRLETLPATELTTHQAHLRGGLVQRIKYARLQTSRATREARTAGKPTETNPRRPVEQEP